MNLHAVKFKKVPKRLIVAIMMFTACWTTFMCRLQMPVLVVKMIHIPDYNDSKSINDSDDHPENAKFIRGQVLAAYAYGHVPGNLIGGLLAMHLGPRSAIFWSGIIVALVSMISPFLFNMHWLLLMISRIIIGLAGGVNYPACHALLSQWAPPNEKSRFVWSLLGGTFGVIVTYPLLGAIVENFGWQWGWYIPSSGMLVWLMFWWFLTYDSPLEHPSISEEEKHYIIDSQAEVVSQEKMILKEIPLRAICTSIPFISLVICHFGNSFLVFLYQYAMMIYLTKALNMSISKGGLIASLPWIGRLVFGFFFSWIGDNIRQKQIVSLTVFRKCASIFALFIPSLFLIGVCYVRQNDVTIINVMLVLALSFNGAVCIVNLANNQDLSPNYAGFLYGIMNTVASASGIILPPLIEKIVGHDEDQEEWRMVFWVGAAVCTISMILFVLGGSGQVQSWNEINKPTEKKISLELTQEKNIVTKF
ncbi:vesicular glutamate transporter 2-like [Trichogramma pretiosum]|uniref:vesicular glutamate transporter 2-like n=1 Tax=Trichogramma pretiosum TaxID=7493 RepID=UPI0006C9C0D7|nr:vesicular glutamate transporter 2-like [Trichogramma pretiosum]